jgi:hypothetical protein
MMFPNLRAEITRRNLTMAEVVEGIWKESGVQISVTHFSLKMNGKYPFTLDEAFAIKKFLKAKVSIDTLFQPELEDE